ncbi:MAG: hypothetical protein FJ130_14180 [Deltaproteobacteria bacterium]|nr:hypothetical protein [Deltaproteobacteria bacterium]
MIKSKGFIFCLFLIFLPAGVHAWTEDIFAHFQPYIFLEEEYNSNIDLTPNRFKKSDYITTISPGFRISMSRRAQVPGEFRGTPTAEERFGLDLDLRAGFVFYGREEDNNYISLNGTLNAWYAFSRNLTFHVRDYLIRSDEIRESDFSVTAPEGQTFFARTRVREPYYRNVFEPSLEYRFGRENVLALNYRNTLYEINSRTAENSVENSINPRLTYWLNVRHGMFLEYNLTFGNLQRSPDWVGNMILGRYIYRFNPRTSVFGEYTQSWRNFDSPSVDYVIYRPSLGVEHAFSPTLSSSARIGYFWQNPKRGSTISGFSYDASLSKREAKTTYTLSFQGGYTEEFFTAENLGFVKTHRVIGRVSHQLMQRMSIGLYGSYERAKYPTPIGGEKPVDRISVAGATATYQALRWLNLSLDLSHRENRANISERRYSEYRGFLRITATY